MKRIACDLAKPVVCRRLCITLSLAHQKTERKRGPTHSLRCTLFARRWRCGFGLAPQDHA